MRPPCRPGRAAMSRGSPNCCSSPPRTHQRAHPEDDAGPLKKGEGIPGAAARLARSEGPARLHPSLVPPATAVLWELELWRAELGTESIPRPPPATAGAAGQVPPAPPRLHSYPLLPHSKGSVFNRVISRSLQAKRDPGRSEN